MVDAATFRELSDLMKGRAFSMAMAFDQSLASELYQTALAAVREHKAPAVWKAEMDDILAAYGGTSPWYADMVIRTNLQSAYAAGRYAEMFGGEWLNRAPLWQYATMQDARVRPEHAMLDGLVFDKRDPASRKYLPPLGYNCRCIAIEIPENETDAYRGKVVPGTHPKENFGIEPPAGWDADRVHQLSGFIPKGLLRPASSGRRIR